MAKSENVSARISDAQPKNSSGNYARLFGDEEIGSLITKIQSASIKAGYVLEDIIASKSTLIPGGNFDGFIDDCMRGKYSGIFLGTKKSDGEKETLEICRSVLGPKLPFITNFYLCAFHAEDRQEIVTGLKGRFSQEEVLTGRELCEILSLDYDEIVSEESRFQRDNMIYFTSKVIDNAKQKIFLISEEDFYFEEAGEA